MYDNYFDDTHPLKPWTQSIPADPRSSAPATNAVREKQAPEFKEGHHPCWDGKKWRQVEDHRGRTGYADGKPYTVAELGPLPAGFTDEKPAPVLTLDEAKADAVQQIKGAGYAAEIKGITLQGMMIPTDRESQSMVTGAVVGTLLKPGKVTRFQTATTQDGIPVFIELPALQMQAIGDAVQSHVQRCFDVRDAKFAEIAGLDAPEAVAAWLDANLQTGWPG